MKTITKEIIVKDCKIFKNQHLMFKITKTAAVAAEEGGRGTRLKFQLGFGSGCSLSGNRRR